MLSTGLGEARLIIYKKAASSLDSLALYAVLAQDTLDFMSKNGEAHHYDVFRKSIWGSAPISISVPATIGDSLIYTKTFSIDPAWPASRIFATAMLQHSDKQLEQAARSGPLSNTGSPEGNDFTCLRKRCLLSEPSIRPPVRVRP